MKQTACCANEIAITADSFSITAQSSVRKLNRDELHRKESPVDFRFLLLLASSLSLRHLEIAVSFHRYLALPFDAKFGANECSRETRVEEERKTLKRRHSRVPANNSFPVGRLHRIRRGYEFTNIKANEVPRVIVRRDRTTRVPTGPRREG